MSTTTTDRQVFPLGELVVVSRGVHAGVVGTVVATVRLGVAGHYRDFVAIEVQGIGPLTLPVAAFGPESAPDVDAPVYAGRHWRPGEENKD